MFIPAEQLRLQQHFKLCHLRMSFKDVYVRS